MGELLFPIILFPKPFTDAWDVGFANASFFFGLIFLAIKLYQAPRDLTAYKMRPKTWLIWGVFVAVQMLVMNYSYFQTADAKQILGLLHGFLLFAQLLIIFYLAFVIQNYTIVDERNIRRYMQVIIISFWVYMLLLLIPQVAYTFGAHGFHDYLKMLAGPFERHWVKRDWYDLGSYTLTSWRVNGFEPESPFLAILLGTIFTPVMMAWVQERVKLFKRGNNLIAWGGLLAVLGVMIVVRSSTGILAAALAIALLVLTSKRSIRVKVLVAALVGVILLTVLYQVNPVVERMLNSFIFEKQGTDNRLGGTIGLLLLVLHAPLFGVGYGFTGYFILQHVPAWSTNNAEFKSLYAKTGYPILNDSLGFMAQYGVIWYLIGAWLLLGLVRRASIVVQRLGDSDEERLLRTTLRAFFFMIAMMVLLSFTTSVQYTTWGALFMFYFYRRTIIITEQRLANQID